MLVRRKGRFPFFLALLSLEAIAGEHQDLQEKSYLKDGPGAAAIVVRDSETILAGAIGLANLELKVELGYEASK